MEKLSNKYHNQGYQTFCFPSNQFGGQEPWENDKIKEFVQKGWPKLSENVILFSKIDVNGNNTHPIYLYLKEIYPGDIKWNFASKFIIGRDGIPCARFDSSQTWEEIESKIVEELNKS